MVWTASTTSRSTSGFVNLVDEAGDALGLELTRVGGILGSDCRGAASVESR